MAPAQMYLGAMYAQGIGVPQDYAQSRQWYNKAADQAVAEAQLALGTFYLHGLGGSVRFRLAQGIAR